MRTSRNEASFFNYMHCGNDPRKRRFALMTSVAALSLASSAPALAQFAVNNGVVSNTVTTSTDANTNTNANAGANSNSIQSFTAPGGIVGVNTSTGSITGSGLTLDGTAGFTAQNQSVTMINNGTIQPTAIVPQALGLFSDGGTITYTGTGSVINAVANGNGIVADASGVFATVGGSVSITASGNIAGTQGIVASSNFGGSVTVQTSGNVTAQESTLGQFAINAITENGNSTVIVDSGIVTGGISSNAAVNGNSSVTINGGTVTSVVNSAIVSQTLNGSNQVTINGGTLSGAAGLAVVNAFVNFTGTGGVTVNFNGGTIDGTVNGSSVGISAINAATSTTGVLVTTGAGSLIKMNGGTGILAQANGPTGGVNVTVGGAITGANIGVDASILNNTNANGVTVSATGPITANNGVQAFTSGGGAVEVTTGTVTGLGGAGTIGINANALPIAGSQPVVQNAGGPGTGAVTVVANGAVSNFANGIDAGNATTTGPVSVTAAAGVTAVAGFGIRATGTTGAVNVDTVGGLVSATLGPGITASSTSGAIQIVTDGVHAISAGGIGGDAIDATTSAGGGITVVSNGAVTSDAGIGIRAVQTGTTAGGNVLVTPLNTVSGVNGIAAAGVATNNVTVTVGHNVTGTAGNGIASTVAAGTANVNVNNVGTTVTGTGAGTSGIVAATGAGGTTNINVGVSATVLDVLGRGITTTATGSGITNIVNAGTIVGAGTAANAVISIGNATGAVTINNLGPGLIANNATATSASKTALAIGTSTPGAAGANNINNSGTLIGRVALASGVNDFTNFAGGQWVVSDGAGVSAAFGGAAGTTLNNAGVIFAAGPSTTFTGLPNLNNTGLFFAGNTAASVTNIGAAGVQTVANTGAFIVNGELNFSGAAASTFTNGGASPGFIDMSLFAGATARDGTVFPASAHATSDFVSLGTTAVTGTSDLNYTYSFGPAYNFVGTPGQSILNLDTNIGAAGSASDRLIISGTATGKTAINVWDTSTGPGVLNLTGITLAAVNGASTNAFFLNGQDNPAHQIPGTPLFDLYEPAVGPMGAIKKGFFFDPLLQDTAGFVAQGGSAAGSRYALFGLPDVEAFQLGIITTAAQNIWEQTALGWLDRQDSVRNWMRANGGYADIPVKAPREAKAESAGPGVWMKAIGSFTSRDVSRGLGDILPAAAVLGNFDLSYKQNIFALMGGVDFGHSAIFTPYDAVVAGLMGGYIDSTLNFKQSPTSFHFTGGTVGVSLSYLQGGWFADGLFKADLLDAGLDFPSLAVFGIGNSSAHVTNIGGLANFGYRWDWIGSWGKWYAEPIATLSYVNTHVDSLSFPGLTASFPNGEAFRGGIGMRLGDVWLKTAQYEIDSSVTGKVWDQFHTNNGVTLQSGGTDLFLDDRYQKVFGEVTGQLNVTNTSTGWSAFTNTGVQFNSQFLTVTGKGGVRYQW